MMGKQYIFKGSNSGWNADEEKAGGGKASL